MKTICFLLPPLGFFAPSFLHFFNFVSLCLGVRFFVSVLYACCSAPASGAVLPRLFFFSRNLAVCLVNSPYI
jgi:hypothetical protein